MAISEFRGASGAPRGILVGECRERRQLEDGGAADEERERGDGEPQAYRGELEKTIARETETQRERRRFEKV